MYASNRSGPPASAMTISSAATASPIFSRMDAQTGERDAPTDRDFSIVVTRVVRYADGGAARHGFTTRKDKPPPPAEWTPRTLESRASGHT